MLGAGLRRNLLLSPGQQDTQSRIAQTAAATSGQTEIEIAVSDQEKINQVTS